jgi:serine/threonine protein phosphatase PrpC
MVDYYYASSQGKRKEMEDQHLITSCPQNKFLLFAVCDGHSGKGVADSTVKILSSRVFKALEQHSSSNKKIPAQKLKSILKKCVLDIDRELFENLTGKAKESGCTLVMALFHKKTRQIAMVNVGDSRAVLQFNNKFIETKDHKPDNLIEFNRIRSAGSFVEKNRVGGILALSRAIGDWSLKKIGGEYAPIKGPVSAEPDILVGTIPEKSAGTLVLACDGVFDVMSSERSMAIVNKHLKEKSNPAKELIKTAYRDGSTDNLTSIIVTIKARG